jgi:hypothetical protein
MKISIQYRLPFMIYTLTLLLLLSACTTGQLDDPAVATEQALVASLTALASDASTDVLVVETPDPSDHPMVGDFEFLSFEVENNYPDSITFYVSATSELPVRRVAFFNWLQGQDSRNLERVEFASGETLTASYTWDTERITVAPSTPIYFNWEFEDDAGNIFISDEMLVYYDDLRFTWNEINDEEIVVRWYEGDQEFGEFVYDTTRISLDQMKAVTGAGLEFPIFVLLYADFEDFASWHFYVEDWVGGQAFTPLGITTQIINSRDNETWIRDVIPHEIAHLFFYQQINTNLASWPSWMDEGFAQYFEFTHKGPALERVERAALADELTPLHYIGGSFGHDPEEVRLAYDESLSVVVFLLETWGEKGLEALINEIRAGATISDALIGAFDVTFEEFEALWITWLGTPATPRPSPTALPTFSVFGAPTGTGTPSP